jgi:hypothetical protein
MLRAPNRHRGCCFARFSVGYLQKMRVDKPLGHFHQDCGGMSFSPDNPAFRRRFDHISW